MAASSPPTSVHDARPLLNHVHLELGHIGKRPAKFGKALPQQGRIILGGAFLADADEYHLPRHPRLVYRQPHEHPCQHLGADDFGVVIPLFRWLPVAVLCHRFISTIAGPVRPPGPHADRTTKSHALIPEAVELQLEIHSSFQTRPLI